MASIWLLLSLLFKWFHSLTMPEVVFALLMCIALILLCVFVSPLSTRSTTIEARWAGIETRWAAIESKVDLLVKQRNMPIFELSHISEGQLSQLKSALNFTTDQVDWHSIALPQAPDSWTTRPPPAFQWNAVKSKEQQSGEYLEYLRVYGGTYKTVKFDDTPPDHLRTFYPVQFSGTTDVIAVDNDETAEGIVLLVAVTPDGTDMKKHYGQAIAQLVAADLLSMHAPVQVVTDLNQSWQFLWIQPGDPPHRFKVRNCKATNRTEALLAIRGVLDSFAKKNCLTDPFHSRVKIHQTGMSAPHENLPLKRLSEEEVARDAHATAFVNRSTGV